MKIKILKSSLDNNDWHSRMPRGGHKGIAQVFLDGKLMWRPIEDAIPPGNDGSKIDPNTLPDDVVRKDIMWRRLHKEPSKEVKDAVLKTVAEYLKSRGYKVRKENPIKYSRKAGCAMCPCSPGYVIYGDYMLGSRRYVVSVWVGADE